MNSINQNKNAVIVFIKFPLAGKVKTRLAQATNDEFAIEFYKRCLKHTLNELFKLQSAFVDIYVFYDTMQEESEYKNLISHNFFLFPQIDAELGVRMSNAFNKVFNADYEKVAIIGSDIPDITNQFIQDAFDNLDNNDVVISPSPDGGYNLLALKSFNENIFSDIAWSTNTVLNNTIAKLNKENLSYHLLPQLIDIDNKDDLIYWLNTGKATFIKEQIKNVYIKMVI